MNFVKFNPVFQQAGKKKRRGFACRAQRGEPVFPYLSALRAAESIGKIPESLIVVRLFDEIRTFFERN